MIYLIIAGIAAIALWFATRKQIKPGERKLYPQEEKSGWNNPEEVKTLIREICDEENFGNYQLAIAIAYVESRFRTDAINKKDRPPSVGIMQIKITTARPYVPSIVTQDDLFYPPYNVRAGVRFLNDLKNKWLSRYGWDGIIQMYNRGETRYLGGERNPDYLSKVSSYLNSIGSRNAIANP